MMKVSSVRILLLLLAAIFAGRVFSRRFILEGDELLNDILSDNRRTAELPDEYSNFLKEMDALETFDQPSHDLSEDQPQNDVPGHQDGVTIIQNNKTMNLPENAMCETRLTAVDIRENQPSHVVFYPAAFVELHRCVGGVHFSVQKLKHCVVKEAEEVSVQVLEMSSGTPTQTTITLLNHTKCSEDCITLESHCDSTKEAYNKANCLCTCLNSSNSCNTTYQAWAAHDCQCVCKYPPDVCLGSNGREEWNTESCQCDCLQSIKKNCDVEGKILDRASCSCVCPAVVCPAGTKLKTTTCTCA